MSHPQSSRPVLDEARIQPPALAAMQSFHSTTLAEVKAAVATHAVVVVGMRHNPVVRKVRRVFKEAGVAYTYLEYGSYVSMWKPRLAVKLWSGWPTFPQVFVNGQLLGGCKETEAALADGSLQAMLAQPRA